MFSFKEVIKNQKKIYHDNKIRSIPHFINQLGKILVMLGLLISLSILIFLIVSNYSYIGIISLLKIIHISVFGIILLYVGYLTKFLINGYDILVDFYQKDKDEKYPGDLIPETKKLF